MKIKVDKLKTFLTKIKMLNENAIQEAIFNFGKEGGKINANNPAKQARVMGWLKTTSFKEYEEIGEIGLNDMDNLIKVIGRFKDIITLSVEGNSLTVKGGGKSVEISLVNKSFISTDDKEPDLEFTDTFTLPKGKLQEIFNDVSLSKDSIITIETAEKAVKISNTGKYKFEHTLDAPTCKGGAKSKFGQPFIDCLTELKEGLEFSMGTNYPIKIIEKSEDSIVTVVVAPRVDNEEDE